MPEGSFVSVDQNVSEIRRHTDWDDWDLIVPGAFGGDNFTDLLFYKRSGGEGLLASPDGSGGISELGRHTDWDKDWDLIIPGKFGVGQSLTDLFYINESGSDRVRLTTLGAASERKSDSEACSG